MLTYHAICQADPEALPAMLAAAQAERAAMGNESGRFYLWPDPGKVGKRCNITGRELRRRIALVMAENDIRERLGMEPLTPPGNGGRAHLSLVSRIKVGLPLRAI